VGFEPALTAGCLQHPGKLAFGAPTKLCIFTNESGIRTGMMTMEFFLSGYNRL